MKINAVSHRGLAIEVRAEKRADSLFAASYACFLVESETQTYTVVLQGEVNGGFQDELEAQANAHVAAKAAIDKHLDSI